MRAAMHAAWQAPTRVLNRQAVRRGAWWLLALLPLALLWPAFRHSIESRMLLHMLLEWPLLFAAGWAAHRLSGHRFRALALLDWRGWSGAAFVSCVAIFWMLPSSIDAALLSAPMAAAKYASWWLAGAVHAGSWRRMDPELLLFFVGNLSWMSATAGMLYLDTPARLCVSYLIDDQRWTGIGLIVLAVALGVVAVRRALRWGEGGAAMSGDASSASELPDGAAAAGRSR